MPPRRRRSRRDLRPLVAVAGVAAAIAFAAGFWWGSRQAPAPVPREAPRPVAPAPPSARPAAPAPAPPRPAAYPPAAGARVAIVVDDLGRGLREIAELEALGIPLTYAVLPFEPRTAEVVADLRGRGAEYLCHLPMEPRNGADPGPGALTGEMGRRRLADATREALAAVDGAAGVSNHMGSKLASDAGKMRAILGVLADRGLFYLDSRTSPDSAGYRVARELGVPAAERRVFLDGDPDPAAIAAQFEILLAEARGRGAAIAIGHPHPATLEVLSREVPRALAAGYEFVPVSYLLDRAGALPR